MREYGGTKSVVITGTSFLGNRNSFMGLAYIVMGCICAFLGIVFLARNFYRPRLAENTLLMELLAHTHCMRCILTLLVNFRKLGDHDRLSWNHQD
jgi:hypothetical protein